MNRIILIGNGFDLAHGLKTSYKDFMDWYWTEFGSKILGMNKVLYHYKDNLVLFNINEDDAIKVNDAIKHKCNALPLPLEASSLCSFEKQPLETLGSIEQFETKYNDLNCGSTVSLIFNNEFFKHISKTSLENWLDIENEYYNELKSYLNLKAEKRNRAVKKLNEELCQVKDLLEKYLTKICEKELSCDEIKNVILENLFLNNGIKRNNVALSKQTAYADSFPEQKKKLLEGINYIIQEENEQSELKKIQAMMLRRHYEKSPFSEMNEEELERTCEQFIELRGIEPEYTLVLNFNYTSTFKKLYAPPAGIKIINIHGELNNEENPIIFGYGDELDDDYKKIENIHDNDFLNNIKSIRYSNTDNYRQLLTFLHSNSYQVFIAGHSCGNSDRTLLNTIFEHPNCISVRPFFHQWKDEDNTNEPRDNYIDMYINISRNFNDKKALRDIVVNKEYCKPLVPLKQEVNVHN